MNVNMNLPNKEAFNKLYDDIESGRHIALTLVDVGRVFGEDFWMLMVIAMAQVNITASHVEIKVNDQTS